MKIFDLVTVMIEVEEWGGKIMLQTLNKNVNKADLFIFCEVKAGIEIPAGLQFHVRGGYINLEIPYSCLDDLPIKIVYDDDEDVISFYLDNVRIAFYISQKTFASILNNLKQLSDKRSQVLKEEYSSDDNEVDIDGFREAIDNRMENF